LRLILPRAACALIREFLKATLTKISENAGNFLKKSVEKWSTAAAFGNLFIWVPAAFRNCVMTALAAF
jgi:hypothetical protein